MLGARRLADAKRLHSAGLAGAVCVVAWSMAGCTGLIEEAEGGELPFSAVNPAAQVAGSEEQLRALDPQLFEAARGFFPYDDYANPRPRMFRLTRQQMQRTASAMLPGLTLPSVIDAMPRDPLQTNYEYADNLRFNEANFTPYVTWAGAVAANVAQRPSVVAPCTAEDRACLSQSATAFVRSAFRGIATDAQVSRYRDYYLAAVDEIGVAAATAELVDLTLTSPSFVFREEVATTSGGQLLPAQLLQQLSYALADEPPQVLGLDSSQAASLVGTPDAYVQTVETILASPQARDKLQRFFLAWLEVREPADFTISTEVFPEFTPEMAEVVVDEVRRFLQHQLATAEPTLKGITRSTEAFVSAEGAELYGLSPQAARLADGQHPVALDPQQRLGVFTMPGVLASHSGPTTTRLVKRGVFFVRKVMCMPLGAPPQGIDTNVPEDAGDTERERIENATSQPVCLGCHGMINPFGFMLEEFDAIGRFRTMDEGHPVDPSIEVHFLEEGPFTASGAVEGLARFTDSARFKQCFARQVFRFYLGRDEEKEDDPVLRAMFFRFALEDRQDIVGMLRSLALSPMFTARTEER